MIRTVVSCPLWNMAKITSACSSDSLGLLLSPLCAAQVMRSHSSNNAHCQKLQHTPAHAKHQRYKSRRSVVATQMGCGDHDGPAR